MTEQSEFDSSLPDMESRRIEMQELEVAPRGPIVGEINLEVADSPVNRGLFGRIYDRFNTTKLGDTISTLGKELFEKNQRIRKIGAFTLGVTTQVLERGRVMIFALPTTFDHTLTYAAEHGLNQYETAAAAAVAVGGLFAAWEYIVGKSFQTSINAFPKTTDKVTENHPAMVGVISKAVSGFPTKEDIAIKQPEKPENGYEVGPYDTRKSKLGKAALALSRGLKTGFLFGTTPHVGIAKVGEHSDRSNNKRLRAVVAESGVAFGGIAGSLSLLVSNNFLGIAQDVREAITNSQNLLGATALIIGSAVVGNIFSRRKYSKEELQAKTNLSDIDEKSNHGITEFLPATETNT